MCCSVNSLLDGLTATMLFIMAHNIRRALGIDPGIERLGWGIVEKNDSEIKRVDSGVKHTSKKDPKSKRLLEIYDFLEKTLKKMKPDFVSTEKLFFATNVKTALTVGEVRGVILLAAERHKVPIIEFAPTEVKMAVCGYGRATKDNIAAMLKFSMILPQKKLLDDETDALALALTGLVRRVYP